MDKVLLDKSAIAKRLGVSPQTIVKWARDKRIPEIRISHKVRRFDFTDVLDALMKETAGDEQ